VKLSLSVVEEPLSCLASLILTLIFAAETIYYVRLLRERRGGGGGGARWDQLPLVVAAVSHGVWAIEYLGSTLFHHHETVLLERWDYCGAIVAFGVNVVANEVLTRPTRPRGAESLWSSRSTVVAGVVTVLVGWSVHRLLFFFFDYGLQNKTVGVLVAMHYAQWIWGMGASGDWRRWSRSARWTLATLGITLAALPAEVGPDFAPVAGFVDGHGLWHVLGIGIAVSWVSLVRERVALLAPKDDHVV
jgi:hypothetical protein